MLGITPKDNAKEIDRLIERVTALEKQVGLLWKWYNENDAILRKLNGEPYVDD